MTAAPLGSMCWTAEALARAGLRAPEARVPIPVGPQDVASLIDGPLAAMPDRVALIGRHRRLTFRALEHEVNAAAAYLVSLGIRAGNRIGASAGNHPELVVAFLAAQRLGAIWVGINRALSPAEKLYLIEDSTPSLLIAEPEIAAPLAGMGEANRPVLVEMRADGDSQWSDGIARFAGSARVDSAIDPWAPAAIAYTSGTTGRPKGAVHSQHNMMVAATIAALVNGDRRPEAIRGTSSPMTILNMMIGGPVSALSTGNPHVCMDRTDVAGIAEWIERERINTLALVPTTIMDLLNSPEIAPERLASLTWVVVGAAMVPQGMAELYQRRFGHKPTIGYGLTENPTVVSRTDDGTPPIEGAIGRPMRHLEVAILDEAGAPQPTGTVGEIAVRAASSGEWAGVYTPTLGYWHQREASDALLRGGWLHTDDVGLQDENGELYIKSRRSDLIVRGGANIYPAEIERVLRMDSRVLDCAVVAMPDARLGEVPAAFVELAAGADPERALEALRARCESDLARYKVPVRWHAIPALPRNAMGKIVKPRLSALLAGA